MKDKGVKYAEVLTDQNNIAAIRAYEKNNFRVIYSSIILSQYLE
jgi:ribosomal protein S18 acetylase RimI-like enzyme